MLKKLEDFGEVELSKELLQKNAIFSFIGSLEAKGSKLDLATR